MNPVPPGLIGHTNLGQKPYDPEKARQLLKQAGQSNLSHRLRPDEGPLSQAARDRAGGGGHAGRGRDQGQHQESGDRHRARAADGGQLRSLLLRLGPHAPRPRLVLRPVVHQGRRGEADALQRIPRSSSSSPRAGCPIPRCARRSTRSSSASCGRTSAELWPYYTVAIYGVSDRLRNFEARRDYYVLLSEVGIV